MRSELAVRTGDGRCLEVLALGAEHELTLLFHNGTPGSRLLPASWERLAADRRLRIVAWDRPGYGSSTASGGRTVASVAADAAAVADALGAGRFFTAGISGGGPHALAVAALLPERVIAAATMGAIGPWGAPGLDFLAGMGELNVEEFGLALEGRDAIAPVLEAQARDLVAGDRRAMIELMRTLVSPPDSTVLDADFGDFLHENMRVGLDSGAEGWLEDDLCFVEDWGFELGSIRVPVLVAHGVLDSFVPVAHGHWLADAIPGAEARIDPEHGHLSLLARFPEIVDWLLAAGAG